ncbi:hypothetical protein [Pyrococcus yayanosii]|uniref:Ribbon-helix-helix protein CopG domain-containing protein n=1 Tax=Pyrococcus yayanosii (strain CH1 / JCM 16557) TaxID=529709 RepID=F8AI04_PYRYC|nr:hypothetical protein [Pyrococcus yayanosii]AEH25461.1 hypothetical protein PYCH_18040 [Pyrococcus yayanosii CH1]
MPNITLSIPEDVYERMKRYKEIKWSEVARRAIVEYLEMLEESKLEESSEEFLEEFGKEFLKELESIPDEKAEEYYKKMRGAEWRRLASFTTRTS